MAINGVDCFAIVICRIHSTKWFHNIRQSRHRSLVWHSFLCQESVKRSESFHHCFKLDSWTGTSVFCAPFICNYHMEAYSSVTMSLPQPPPCYVQCAAILTKCTYINLCIFFLLIAIVTCFLALIIYLL